MEPNQDFNPTEPTQTEPVGYVAPIQSEELPQPAPELVQAPEQQIQTMQSEPQSQNVNPATGAPAKSPTKWIIVGIGVVLALAVLGYFGFKYFYGSKTGSNLSVLFDGKPMFAVTSGQKSDLAEKVKDQFVERVVYRNIVTNSGKYSVPMLKGSTLMAMFPMGELDKPGNPEKLDYEDLTYETGDGVSYYISDKSGTQVGMAFFRTEADVVSRTKESMGWLKSATEFRDFLSKSKPGVFNLGDDTYCYSDDYKGNIGFACQTFYLGGNTKDESGYIDYQNWAVYGFKISTRLLAAGEKTGVKVDANVIKNDLNNVYQKFIKGQIKQKK
jgi:hypothetical protein